MTDAEFHAAFEQHKDAVYRFAWRMSGSATTAEDITQDAPCVDGCSRHPGPGLGYVVEGQMRFAINQEAEQILPVGGTFLEPSGAVHTTNGSARPDGPTRAVVFMLVPKGSPLTSPA